MAQVAITSRLQFRNEMGQFTESVKGAAAKTIAEAIEEGAAISRAKAPVGVKPDPRTIPLKASIDAVQESRTKGFWGSSARHALYVEEGTAPHDIPARVHFFWDAEGRYWMWPETYERRTGFPGADPISHPGAGAQPFLAPAYEIMRKRMLKIYKKYMP